MSDSTWKPWSERLKDPRWQKKRLQILQLANFSCEDCRRRDKTLEVHHCVYISGAEPWEYDASLLMAVCGDCHEFRQSREDAIRVHLAGVFRYMTPVDLQTEADTIIQQMSARQTARMAAPFMTDDEEAA